MTIRQRHQPCTPRTTCTCSRKVLTSN
jgi:hypothetical protein